MRFEIYDEPKKSEPVCRFKLIDYGNGNITLVAVDESGDRLPQGDIVTLYPSDGKIWRHTNCSVPGISVNKMGKITERTGD